MLKYEEDGSSHSFWESLVFLNEIVVQCPPLQWHGWIPTLKSTPESFSLGGWGSWGTNYNWDWGWSRWMGALTWKMGWWSWLDLGGWGRGWRQVAGAVMQYPAHWTDQPLDTCSDGRTSNGITNLENLPEMPRNTSVWPGCKMFGILDKFKPGQPGLLVGRPRRLFWDQKDTDRCTVR